MWPIDFFSTFLGQPTLARYDRIRKLIVRIFVSVQFEDGCSSGMGPCTSRCGDSRNLVQTRSSKFSPIGIGYGHFQTCDDFHSIPDSDCLVQVSILRGLLHEYCECLNVGIPNVSDLRVQLFRQCGKLLRVFAPRLFDFRLESGLCG